MTTLVAVVTKDALVMGCDTLGTVTRNLLDPTTIADEFFDPSDGYKLRRDANGQPLLDSIGTLLGRAQEVPYNHMAHVNKLIALDPLPIAAMYTGITSIGERTVRSLLMEFADTDNAFKNGGRSNYTVNSVGKRVLAFLHRRYEATFTDPIFRPSLEILIGGYDRNRRVPSVRRINVSGNSLSPTLDDPGFGIVFGGQMREIQRLVFGTDPDNQVKLILRHKELMSEYQEQVKRALGDADPTVTIPEPTSELFDGSFSLDGLAMGIGDYSTQNAIECVDFLVNVMIKSQQFSEQLPTVGGEVNVAVIQKDEGVRMVSGETWRHGENIVDARLE